MTTGIIVIGGHIQGLGILRILGREEIPGIIIDSEKKNLARYSKYCNAFFQVTENNLLDFLRRKSSVKRFAGWVLFPTNDFHVRLLSVNKRELEEHYIVSTDNWDVVRRFYNKKETYKLAQQLKIPIPFSFYPKNINQLDNSPVSFPCIIKPAIMHVFYKKFKKKVFVCHNLTELKVNYRNAREVIPADEIIIQEIIKGPSKNQFSVCFLFLNGKSYVSLTANRMRQHPLDFGNATTYAETVDLPQLKKYGEKILSKVNYNGICEVEFKLDENDNQYKFLEVNSRTWKWHTIANKANTPFLKVYFDYLTGKEIIPSKGFNKASFWHLITDLPVSIQLLFNGYKYWWRKSKPIEHALWATDDIMPWFVEKIFLPYYIINR